MRPRTLLLNVILLLVMWILILGSWIQELMIMSDNIDLLTNMKCRISKVQLCSGVFIHFAIKCVGVFLLGKHNKLFSVLYVSDFKYNLNC